MLAIGTRVTLTGEGRALGTIAGYGWLTDDEGTTHPVYLVALLRGAWIHEGQRNAAYVSKLVVHPDNVVKGFCAFPRDLEHDHAVCQDATERGEQ